MKLSIIILGLALSIGCSTDANLVWSDEFDVDGQPDSTKWTYDLGDGCPNICGWGNDERESYTNNPENVRIENGALVIEAHQISAEDSTYSSTRIKSHNDGSWKYGYIEISAKIPEGRGVWPALWMLPDDWKYGGWPKSGEIDIMENVGYEPDEIHGTVHTGAFNHSIGTQVGKSKIIANTVNEFHLYAIDWTADKIDFLIDNEIYHTFENNGSGPDAWPFDQSFHLIMNVAVGGGWGGKYGTDPGIWPQQMVIDYARVYKQRP